MTAENRMLIESFEGPKGRAEVFEIVGKDATGIEQVMYEIQFNGDIQNAQSMGEASIRAADLAGDPRFKGNH
jgi:hypothetical protein